jgi:hypothetical protein
MGTTLPDKSLRNVLELLNMQHTAMSTCQYLVHLSGPKRSFAFSPPQVAFYMEEK